MKLETWLLNRYPEILTEYENEERERIACGVRSGRTVTNHKERVVHTEWVNPRDFRPGKEPLFSEKEKRAMKRKKRRTTADILAETRALLDELKSRS